MAKELRITKKYGTGLRNCTTEKVVDITEDCPRANVKNQCILIFTRAEGGRIVQIARPYEGVIYAGSRTDFFVDELASLGDSFCSQAILLGLNELALRRLIETHAPSI